jgi:DNA-binding transcriptional ArsR family regulator
MDTLALLLHPVRLRIVHALRGKARTIAELCERLPDASKATVYRQVNVLADGGLIEVADEHRVHGAVERRYQLVRSAVAVDPAAGAAMSADEHREAFATAVAALVGDFNAYLDRPDSNPYRDRVGYTQIPLWLTRAELVQLQRVLRDAVIVARNNPPGSARRLHLLSPIIFPIEDAPDETTPNGEPGRGQVDRNDS